MAGCDGCSEVVVLAMPMRYGLKASERPAPKKPADPADRLNVMVTLNQAAGMVHRAKRTLDKYTRAMPAPAIRGQKGRSSLWSWSEIRPWLEKEFGQQLPEQFPAKR